MACAFSSRSPVGLNADHLAGAPGRNPDTAITVPSAPMTKIATTTP